MAYRKKLIEVALPLEAINRESAREKSIRHGHPSTLHLWWARRPLAACRAVLFASLVDDPSAHPDRFPTEEVQEAERKRLFAIIEALVKWENVNNVTVLEAARAEILRSTGGNPPPVLDPFCGGGSIPLEAQRLGLEAHASDLNPVAVLITKALIEIPPKFAGRPPVCPQTGQQQMPRTWKAAQGLAEDVRYYGQWIRDRILMRIGHLYPTARLPKEYGGGEARVIAWLWARTVSCPNPACGARMPLVRTFGLSTKKGMKTWVEPTVDHAARTVSFTICSGTGSPPQATVNRRGAHCIVCGTPVPFDHVRTEGKAGRIGAQMMAIVAEHQRGRIYLPPTPEHEDIAAQAQPEWAPETDLPQQALGFRVQLYGMVQHRDLFTARQLVALTTLSDLVGEAREQVYRDAVKAGMTDDGIRLDFGGAGATAYADALATYLGLTPSKAARFNTVLSYWRPDEGKLSRAFGRQTVSMTWDFAETNPFANAGGDFQGLIEGTADVLLRVAAQPPGECKQADASSKSTVPIPVLICTDPPYYDNVAYADLSDIFYTWLRRSLRQEYGQILDTMLVPKESELIADPYRRGSRDAAQVFFEEGLSRAFRIMRSTQDSRYPLVLYYAFKQEEDDDPDQATTDTQTVTSASTGWETMLEGLIGAGFQINGTWPVRTEGPTRMRGQGSNALASSIVLVCRPRLVDAPVATRRDFRATLKREMPEALRNLQHGNIAPVDLAQASIGPGMSVFSRYTKVLEIDGSPMRVRTALQIINEVLDEVVAEQDSEYDADTRWAIAWYEQFGLKTAPYGEAETLSKAKNTSVRGLEEAGILEARAGKVRLLGRKELAADWDPARDRRFTVWEAAQHLARALDEGGDGAAGALLGRMDGRGELARDLANRLYLLCERKGWSEEARAYNALGVAWPEIAEEARMQAQRAAGPTQTELALGQ